MTQIHRVVPPFRLDGGWWIATPQRLRDSSPSSPDLPEWLEEFLFHPWRFFGRLLGRFLEAV